jgi:hypothetical protein
MPIKIPISFIPTLIVLAILFIIPYYFLSVLGETYGYDDRTRWFGKIFLSIDNKVALVILFYIIVGVVVWFSGVSLSLPW